MDKTKLKELIKEEVQALLSEAPVSDKYRMIDITATRLEEPGITDKKAKALAAGLRDIVKQLRGELNEADMRSPGQQDFRSLAQKLQSVIRRLNAVGNAYFRHLAAELEEISDELEGR